MKISTSGRWFVDERGRKILLRGINLGGGSKLPYGVGPLDSPEASAALSFVGRPFPLAEADDHFRRLRGWGFNVLRLLTTWEAICPHEPGRYDEAYLDYFTAIVKRAGDHGFAVFIDPHQDAWSRWTGGDGAPGWTLDVAGLEKNSLDAAEAAVTLPGRYPNYEPMTWPNNWYRLGSSTLFTLFFAGATFAPGLRVEGKPIDEYLQGHFVAALREVARRIADFPHVLGFDSLNEPTAGFIGVADLNDPRPVYHCGPQLTGFDSMCLGAGFARTVPFVRRERLENRVTGRVTLNEAGARAWKSPAHDVWKNHGVWDQSANGRPELLDAAYFSKVNFARDCLAPFAERYARALREVAPRAILFIEDQPGDEGEFSWESDIPIVNANHWYDLLTLITRRYDPEQALVWGTLEPVRGRAEVRASFRRQIAEHVAFSARLDCPTLVGEFGVPFDLAPATDARGAGEAPFHAQTEALGEYYDALDHSLVSATLWNYTPDNDDSRGDGWNLENLSVFSRADGGRAVRGFCRPTLVAGAGTPLAQNFDRATRTFTLQIEVDAAGVSDTEVFVPRIWFPEGVEIFVTSGHCELNDQTLRWSRSAPGKQALRLAPKLTNS